MPILVALAGNLAQNREPRKKIPTPAAEAAAEAASAVLMPGADINTPFRRC